MTTIDIDDSDGLDDTIITLMSFFANTENMLAAVPGAANSTPKNLRHTTKSTKSEYAADAIGGPEMGPFGRI